jgi:predicted nucleic acid-binding protein
MRLFIDTNVVMDYLAARKPFFAAAEKVISMGDIEGCELCISSLSFTTLFYILRKQKNREELLQLLDWLQEVMVVVSVGSDEINNAIHSDFSDFEDAVQYYAAIACGAERIISRDRTGFANSSIPVVTPEDFDAHELE